MIVVDAECWKDITSCDHYQNRNVPNGQGNDQFVKQGQSFSSCQKNYSKNIDQNAHQGYPKANNTFAIETKTEKKVHRILSSTYSKKNSHF